MFRIRIRTKLLGALAVPLAMIVFVAVIEVRRAEDDRAEARAEAALAKQQTETALAAIGPGSLLAQLIDTRSYWAAYGIGALETFKKMGPTVQDDKGDPAKPEVVRQRLLDAIDRMKGSIADAPRTVQDVYGPAIANLEGKLPQIFARHDIQVDPDFPKNPGNPEAVTLDNSGSVDYNQVISMLLDAGTTLTLSVADPELRKGVDLLDLSARRSDFELRILTDVGAAAGLVDPLTAPEGKHQLAETRGQLRTNIDASRIKATGLFSEAAPLPFDPQGDKLVSDTLDGKYDGKIGDAITKIVEYATGAAERGTGPMSNATGVAATKALETHAAELQAEAADDASDATNSAENARRLAILGVLAAMLVTFLASLSITRPLRKLTQQAEEMASYKLPNAVQDILSTPMGEDVQVPELEPVYVKTRDEVRDVAAALNVVQESAVGLAVEQAVLRRNIADSFVNLGRRNQNLIGRQLDFITELERNEADPDTLENLFKLDHLATRMRRNAESLLVLAGLEPPRQWSAPVDVANIIRAALAEVEGYQRVQQRHLDPATVAGSAAADLAHVLAELIENALVFSPPESAVEVFGRAGNGVYTLSVVDQGIGMSPEQLQEANGRLAGTESFTVAPSRYLGHYVAGHLARRVGVAIDLLESPSGGVAVRISIPKALLASQAKERESSDLAPEILPGSGTAIRPAATIIDFPVTEVPQGAPRDDVPTGDAPAPIEDAPPFGAPSRFGHATPPVQDAPPFDGPSRHEDAPPFEGPSRYEDAPAPVMDAPPPFEAPSRFGGEPAPVQDAPPFEGPSRHEDAPAPVMDAPQPPPFEAPSRFGDTPAPLRDSPRELPSRRREPPAAGPPPRDAPRELPSRRREPPAAGPPPRDAPRELPSRRREGPAPTPRPLDAPAAFTPTPYPDAATSAPTRPVRTAAPPAQRNGPATTPGGLKRRVKGANAVSTTPTVINRRAAESSADAAEPNRTDVFRFLTGFQGSGDNKTSNGESK